MLLVLLICTQEGFEGGAWQSEPEVETLRVGLLLDGHGAMEGPRTTDHGGNDERAAGHHRGYPLFETDYQLLEEIGHGANGSSIVFRAICLPNNEVVAIKCLDPATCHRTLVCFHFALPFLTLPPVFIKSLTSELLLCPLGLCKCRG